MSPGLVDRLRTVLRQRRFFPRARRVAKLLIVQWDIARHRNDPAVKKWLPVFAGARSGHVVVPTIALASSRGQAMDFVRHDLVHPGDRVLDVGAGNGRQAIGLLEVGVASYVGLEIERGSVEHANRAFATLGPVHFDFLDLRNPMYNPDGIQLPEEVIYPYPDGSFDFVVASSVYTHMERIQVVTRNISETARVLSDDGGAFMSFFRSPPNTPSDSAIRSVFEESAIRSAVEEHFVIEDALNGATTGFHDQWTLYLRKR